MNYTRLFLIFVCTALVCNCGDSPDATTTPGSSSATDDSSTEAPTSAPATDTDADATGETDASATDMTTGDPQELLNCDPWAQDCPDGFKCMAYTDEGDYFTGTKCTPVVPNGGVAGDECYADGGWATGVDDCALGYACWNINPETSIGGCVAQCTGTMDDFSCPDPEDICVFWVPGLAHVCLDTCDPFLQDCPSDQVCGPNWASGGQEFVCYLDWSFEKGQEFGACQGPNTCDPGLICWDPSQAVECDQNQGGCCLSYCDLDAPDCGGAGAVCEPFYEAGTAPPQYANLGICGLPG